MPNLTEEDVKFRFITPAINNAGWSVEKIAMEYFFTDGMITVQGNVVFRGERKKADYLLFHQDNFPLAIVEAKKGTSNLGDGMQQAIAYAGILNVPFAYSSNGSGFLEHDMLNGTERELSLAEFPSPESLWNRYRQENEITPDQESMLLQQYYIDTISRKTPRYYQMSAINKTIEAVAKDQKRILLVMATGTGKTYTAFQIVHRLLESKKVQRVLYLADRNVLIDQTMIRDFKPFTKIMTKIQNRSMDSSYQIYMALYQQLIGEGENKPYKEFSPDFFDLIIVDECHRGSAREDSLWREILEYYSTAVQIGMTATPKETKYISNIEYFGDPVYTYSLKQGIEDGFLAPYKVIRVNLDKDVDGWRPYEGQLDDYGLLIDDYEYSSKDFDRTLILDQRTQAVAKRISDWLKENGRQLKTIVFCVDIEHAERMRQALVNENSDMVAENPMYVSRITGDNPDARKLLDRFIDPSSVYPTVVTTSKLLTTGVDVQTCQLIAIDSVINSVSEFKQIIGRGTRIYQDQNKYYFTILDFRKSTRLFADPDFDGTPIVIKEETEEGEVEEIFESEESESPFGEYDEELVQVYPPVDSSSPPKFRLREVAVAYLSEQVQYIGPNGKLITESLRDFTKRNILNEYATLQDFLDKWQADERKEAIIAELQTQGIWLEVLQAESDLKDLDPFDIVCHLAYGQPPLTRKERAKRVRQKDIFSRYSGEARAVLDALVDKYMNDGVMDLDDTRILLNKPFVEIGTPARILGLFGGREAYVLITQELEDLIYK